MLHHGKRQNPCICLGQGWPFPRLPIGRTVYFGSIQPSSTFACFQVVDPSGGGGLRAGFLVKMEAPWKAFPAQASGMDEGYRFAAGP